MFKTTLLLSLMLSLPSAFAAANECSLQPSDLKSALNLKVKYYESKTPVARTKYGISQSVVLKGGQAVSYEAGGCEHYSYSFTYRNVPQDLSKLTMQELAELAVELLNSTPVLASKKAEKQTIIEGIVRGLKDGTINENEAILQCGDATCGLGLMQDNTMSLTYSFAL